MNRRAFLAFSGRTMTVALAASAARTKRLTALELSQSLPDRLEQRVAAAIQAYDAQGNHRTGTEVDKASAEWLADQVHQAGAQPSLEAFNLSRIDPQSCYMRIADRRIDGVPLFDAAFTGPEGVRGRLGAIGSEVEIGLAETTPFKLTDPGMVQHQVVAARHGQHKAVLLLTRGTRPGLFLLNASAFTKPFGPPMLQVSSVESEWLKAQARRRAETTLVAHVERTAARGFNVTATIAGSNPTLAPIVLMAPRSGWWQCASEQGSRLACWLEAMRVLAIGEPARDCFFVALSGHELGYLGIEAYLESRRDLITRAHAWVFLGSSIGEPHQVNRIHASDDVLEQWLVAAMNKEGLAVDGKAPRESLARGETGVVQRGGGRFVTLACDSDVYHNVADRWPEAVDVSLLSRYASALANGMLELANQA